METKMTIWNVVFENIVFNCSWPSCTTYDELETIWKSDSSWIMMKSCSIDPRDWNPLPRYSEVKLWSINSMWLPNLWYKKYIEFSTTLKNQYKKPVIASVVWFDITSEESDFRQIVKEMQNNSDIDLIEVNLSCPNVVWKPQIWYDFEASEKLIKQVVDLWTKPIWLKLPPYFEPIHQEQMANIIKKYNVSFITCINSVWNTLIIDPETETPLIKPKGWFWGLGGDYVKPIALANVRWFYKLLWDKVKIIWVWGISNWIDVFEFLLAWASIVQIGTVFAKEGESCFYRINEEFKNYTEKKGYKDISEIIWKLKEL